MTLFQCSPNLQTRAIQPKAFLPCEVDDPRGILVEPNGDYTGITATPQVSFVPDEDPFLRVQIAVTPQS